MDKHTVARTAKPYTGLLNTIAIGVTSLVLISCESKEELNQLTTLSGPYCSEPKLGDIALCLCYDYTAEGTFELLYGREGSNPNPETKPVFGTYTLNQRVLKTSVIGNNGKEANEEWNLVSSKALKNTSDGMTKRRKNETPELCLR